jgi:hypothetical protein
MVHILFLLRVAYEKAEEGEEEEGEAAAAEKFGGCVDKCT